MAADEEKPKYVVAIVSVIEFFDDVCFGVFEIGKLIFFRQRLLLCRAALGVDGDVAADEDEPRGGIPGRAVFRPSRKRFEARFLISLFRRVEVAKIAEQRAHRLRPRRGERRFDPGEVAHA